MQFEPSKELIVIFHFLPGGLPHPSPKAKQYADGPQLKILPFGCPDCDETFSDEEKIMDHMAKPPHNFVAPTTEPNADKEEDETAPIKEEGDEDESDVAVDVKKHPQGSGTILCPVLTCNKLLTTLSRLVQHLRLGKHNQPCPACNRVFVRVSFA